VRLNGVQEVVGSNPAGPRLIGLSLYLQANYVIYSCGIGASAGNEFLGVLVTSVSVSPEIRYSSRRIRMQYGFGGGWSSVAIKRQPTAS
jgi:hypothetical protein